MLMSVTFLALRVAPDGSGPVVVKVQRPSFVRESQADAVIAAKKETLALAKVS